MMDDLIVKYLAGETDAHENDIINEWLASSDENRRHFEQMTWVWEQSDTGTEATIPIDEAWARFNILKEKQHKTERNDSNISWYYAAAALVVVAIGAWYWFSISSNYQSLLLESGTEVTAVTLPDGSKVTLNANSSLQYPSKFNSEAREVTLVGEGYFDIVSDSDHPFIVNLDKVRITVLGTAFNARSRNNKTRIDVESGRVQVENESSSAMLTSGESLTVYADSISFDPVTASSRLYQHYRLNAFICEDTPLIELFEVLSDAYGVQIQVADPAIYDLRISATFSDEPISIIMDIIAETFKIDVTRDGSTYLVSER